MIILSLLRSTFHERMSHDMKNLTIYETQNFYLSSADNHNSTFRIINDVNETSPNFYGFNFYNLNNQIQVYSSIIVFLFIFSMIRTTVFFQICITASINLHNRMLASLIRAPMKFFDLNNSGTQYTQE